MPPKKGRKRARAAPRGHGGGGPPGSPPSRRGPESERLDDSADMGEGDAGDAHQPPLWAPPFGPGNFDPFGHFQPDSSNDRYDRMHGHGFDRSQQAQMNDSGYFAPFGEGIRHSQPPPGFMTFDSRMMGFPPPNIDIAAPPLQSLYSDQHYPSQARPQQQLQLQLQPPPLPQLQLQPPPQQQQHQHQHQHQVFGVPFGGHYNGDPQAFGHEFSPRVDPAHDHQFRNGVAPAPHHALHFETSHEIGGTADGVDDDYIVGLTESYNRGPGGGRPLFDMGRNVAPFPGRDSQLGPASYDYEEPLEMGELRPPHVGEGNACYHNRTMSLSRNRDAPMLREQRIFTSPEDGEFEHGEIQLPRPQSEIDQLRRVMLSSNPAESVGGECFEGISPVYAEWPGPGQPLLPARSALAPTTAPLAPTFPAQVHDQATQQTLLTTSNSTKVSRDNAQPKWRSAAGRFRQRSTPPPATASPFLEAGEEEAGTSAAGAAAAAVPAAVPAAQQDTSEDAFMSEHESEAASDNGRVDDQGTVNIEGDAVPKQPVAEQTPPPPPPPPPDAEIFPLLSVVTVHGVTSAAADSGKADRGITVGSAGQKNPPAEEGAPVAKASVGSAVVGGGGQVCSKPWHNHALVLVGAATAVLPRGALVSAAKICGARWVSRYELGDQRSLPEDVNPVMAKALADQLPSCVSVDENETGLEFLLLMTFASALEKVAAVARLAELRFDTSDFDNSPRVQVEQVRVAPAPPSTPAPLVDDAASSSALPTATPEPEAIKQPNEDNGPDPNSGIGGEGGGEGGGHALEEALRRKTQQGLQAKRLIAAAAAAAAAAQAGAASESCCAMQEACDLTPKKSGGLAPSPHITVVEAGATTSSLSPRPRAGAAGTSPNATPSTVQPTTATQSQTESGAVEGEVLVDPRAFPSSLPIVPREKSRTPSPVPPKMLTTALATARSDVRGVSPPQRALGNTGARGVSPTPRAGGNLHWKAAPAAATRSTVTPLKALNKRLVVMPPSLSDPPDPTKRKWNFGFDGPYFKLLDRDLKTGEVLRCDQSKNSSYVGVIPPTKIVIAGLREIVYQKKIAAATAAAVAAGAAPGSASPAGSPSESSAAAASASFRISSGVSGATRTSGDGSNTNSEAGSNTNSEAGSNSGSSEEVISKARNPTTVSSVAIKTGSHGAVAIAPAIAVRSGAGWEGRSSSSVALASGGSSVGGVSSADQIMTGVGVEKNSGSLAPVSGRGMKRPLPRGNLAVRIAEVQEELQALQETKIPRVMKAFADVSQNRRKLEALVVSIAVKNADAEARLARDSRDAAAALMEELRARREATSASASASRKQQQQVRRREDGDKSGRGTTVSALRGQMEPTTGTAQGSQVGAVGHRSGEAPSDTTAAAASPTNSAVVSSSVFSQAGESGERTQMEGRSLKTQYNSRVEREPNLEPPLEVTAAVEAPSFEVDIQSRNVADSAPG